MFDVAASGGLQFPIPIVPPLLLLYIVAMSLSYESLYDTEIADVWRFFGGISAVLYKLGTRGQSLWYVVMLLGAVAAYLAIAKPF